MSCSKNRHAHKVDEANCFARFKHLKQSLKNTCPMTLALFNSPTKRYSQPPYYKIP